MSTSTTRSALRACCGPDSSDDAAATKRTAETVSDAVRQTYGNTATSGLSSDHAGVRAVAEAFGYTSDELSAIPAEANMGLSCGNPTATANLRPGEVVVDLGSGGGLDVFLAAKKVGPTGKAIGIDMTEEMVALARRNAAKDGAANVEFHLATIDRLPLADASVDVVISNCVINLAPDKPAVFREIVRVLKPGGRLAVSDIALKRPLPAEIAQDVTAYVGCIAGALEVGEYCRLLSEAGFADVAVVDACADLHAYAKVEGQAACCSPAKPQAAAPAAYRQPVSVGVSSGTTCCAAPELFEDAATVHSGLSDLLARYDVNDYAASVKVYAVKPKA